MNKNINDVRTNSRKGHTTGISDSLWEDLDKELEFITDNYYTFLTEPGKGKYFGFFRKQLFKYLFRYSYRQVIFNDHLKNLLSSLIGIVKTRESMIETQLHVAYHKEKDSPNQNIDASSLIEIHARMNALAEIQNINEASNKIPNQPFYSQFGEDLWLYRSGLLPQNGYFIDVGASDGITFSNTYFFERRGWKGICIEPNPVSFSKCKKVRSNTIHAAVGDKNETEFYLSSLSPDLSGYIKSDQKDSVIEMKSTKLSEIINREKITKIDLLSIDTEGTEEDVMKSLENKLHPKIVLVEYNTQGTISKTIANYFTLLKYKIIHKTKANYIFLYEG